MFHGWNRTFRCFLLLNRVILSSPKGISVSKLPIHHPIAGRTNPRNCAGVSHRLTFLSTSPKSQSRQKEGLARLTSSYAPFPLLRLPRIPIRRRYIPRSFWPSSPRILRKSNRWIGRCDGRGQKRPSRQKVTFRAASCHPIEVHTVTPFN